MDTLLKIQCSRPEAVILTCGIEQVALRLTPHLAGSLDKNSKDVGTGIVGAPACGDVMKLQIKVSPDGRIEDAKFKTFGCGSAIASRWVPSALSSDAAAWNDCPRLGCEGRHLPRSLRGRRGSRCCVSPCASVDIATNHPLSPSLPSRARAAPWPPSGSLGRPSTSA